MRLLLALPACLLSLALLLPPAALAQTNTRACDANAMIYCGAYSKDELIRKMTQGDGQNSTQNIRGLFNTYNILPRDVRSSNTVNGEVRKDGTVWVQGKKVATGAYSYGRENLAGSTKQGSLYKRPTSVSFNSNSLPAYVHMSGGKFKWAIIKSCGNLVTATPVTPPAKKVTAKPAPVVQQIAIQQVIVEKPVEKVVERKVVEKQVVEKIVEKPLPQTGTETNMASGLFGVLGISGALGLFVRSRERVFDLLTNIA